MVATSKPSGALRLLLVDDEPAFHDLVRPYLRDYQIDHAYNAVQAMEMVNDSGPFDVVLLDLGLPGSNGFELLASIREVLPSQPVIVVTGYANFELAHEAGRRGATFFCDKCLETYQRLDKLIASVLAPPVPEVPVISASAADDLGVLARLEASRNAKVVEEVDHARRRAGSVAGAVIEGEEAVGKLGLAHLIHRTAKADRPIATINARGLADEELGEILFGASVDGGEMARVSSGTLVLRGLERIPLRIQRRIAQTHDQLKGPLLIATCRGKVADEVVTGAIAPELWDHIRFLSLTLPPLRARRDDIADLVDSMAAHWAARLGARRPSFDHSVLRVLVAYDWPGNLAQMSDLVARLVGLWSGETIATDHLPPDYFLPMARAMLGEGESELGDADDASLLRRAREHFERYFIRLIVSRHQGDKRAAARTLGMSYRTLSDKLRSDPDGWADDD